jgi:hypothetical protein
MFDFIEELKEARMFRGSDTLRGKSANDVAKMAFTMFLMLEILRQEDPNYAKDYVRKTMDHTNFDSMRTSATDLHNLLAVLNNQQKYSARVTPNPSISVPVLAIRRYFREVLGGRKDRGLDRALLQNLQNSFKVSSGELSSARRNVADWYLPSKTEKAVTKRALKNVLQSTAHQADIFVHFKSKL